MVAKKYSVIIPTFNRAGFLARAIESVLAQTATPSEIIVVDDGSTDTTKELLQNYPQIIYIYKENGGVSSARNVGVKAAKYEYIAFLDSDDSWHKEKMQLQLECDAVVSYTDEVWIREGKEIKIPKKFRKNSPATLESEIAFCNIAPSSVLIHKKVFDEVGLFDESLEVCEDYDLWLRILLKYNIELVDKKLIKKYAGHSDQLSFKHWGMDRFRVQSLEKLYKLSQDEVIYTTLLSKYKLLIQGFEKRNKKDEVLFYENRIQYLKNNQVETRR